MPARPITIALAGDVHFEGQLRSRLNDPSTALNPIALHLSAADLMIVNLETSIGTSGDPEPKRFTFQAPPAHRPCRSSAHPATPFCSLGVEDSGNAGPEKRRGGT
jgi:hypothetical protein